MSRATQVQPTASHPAGLPPPVLMPHPLQIPHPSTRASLQPVLEVNPVLQHQQVGRTVHREEALCCKQSLFKASILLPMDTDHGPNQGALPRLWLLLQPAWQSLVQEGPWLLRIWWIRHCKFCLLAHKHDIYPVSVTACVPLHISMSLKTSFWFPLQLCGGLIPAGCQAFTQALSLPLLNRTVGEN